MELFWPDDRPLSYENELIRLNNIICEMDPFHKVKNLCIGLSFSAKNMLFWRGFIVAFHKLFGIKLFIYQSLSIISITIYYGQSHLTGNFKRSKAAMRGIKYAKDLPRSHEHYFQSNREESGTERSHFE